MSSIYYGDKFKWFVGIVKKVSDDRARVKVRIFGIHRMDDEQRLSNEDLPWALVVYPTTSGGGSGALSHDLKDEDWVVGFFADGSDCREPIVLGVFSGGENSTSYTNPGGEGGGGGFGGAGGAGASGGPSGTGAAPSFIAGGSNPQKAYNFFREKLEKKGISGDPHIVASTIVGFLQVESGPSLDHTILNTTGSSAYGIAQWLGGRRDNLFRRWGIPNPGRSAFARRGNFTTGPTFEQQLQFIWEEFFTGDARGAMDYLSTARTIRDAGIGMIRYERNEAWEPVGDPKGPRIVNTNHPVFNKGVRFSEQNVNNFKYTASAPPTPSGLAPGSGI